MELTQSLAKRRCRINCTLVIKRRKRYPVTLPSSKTTPFHSAYVAESTLYIKKKKKCCTRVLHYSNKQREIHRSSLSPCLPLRIFINYFSDKRSLSVTTKQRFQTETNILYVTVFADVKRWFKLRYLYIASGAVLSHI